MRYHIGVDIGSISVNTVIINEYREILAEFYDYTHGRPFKTLLIRLQQLKEEWNFNLSTIAFTGTGGRIGAKLLNGVFVNEIIAQAGSVSELYPEVRTIIEMGGEDSKLIFLGEDGHSNGLSLADFSMNNLCAAGTGSFLDQQAKRLGVSIEKEFGELALKSKEPPRIAGRCSVFAKSDMIHLQQTATPVHDIIAGLCFAVARNFKSTLGKGKIPEKPVIFQGGVAANQGMIRAFREIYQLDEDELIIPEHYASMGALGAIFYSLENGQKSNTKIDTEQLNNYLKRTDRINNSLQQLKYNSQKIHKYIHSLDGQQKVEAYLGIDVGSLSTNLAVIDSANNVLARRYLPTAGKPIEAIKRGLAEIGNEIGARLVIKGVGTTGSGRYLTGDFVGADIIQNEITCQATATIEHDPEADTIFEIGGQDSKYIRISNGVIVDFEMNKVCAAGTGSFLEEQAERLGINIREEFAALALDSKSPAKLGERCTVFMESDLNTHQQKGLPKEDMVAGLAYSIVQNYLNRVVRDKPVGKKIYFQGGVTNNQAVVAAFEQILGKKIYIPPHFDVTGAIGAAMLAKNKMKRSDKSGFKGFSICNTQYSTHHFICKYCPNHCEIKRLKIEGEKKALFYGGICERYEKDEQKTQRKNLPDLFKERESMLLSNYTPSVQSTRIKVGFPRALMNFYQNFPFWNAFFSKLGFDIVISDETDRRMVTESLETMVSETCLPVELVHGHILNLLKKHVDYIFLPFIVNVKGSKENPTNNCNCPWIQATPYLVKAAFPQEEIRDKLLMPTLHFRYFDRVLRKELQDFILKQFNISKTKSNEAIDAGSAAQKLFEESVKRRGQEVLDTLDPNEKNLVLLGRPYNTGDPSLNLRLIKKLLNMDILPIPLDFLPFDEETVFDDYPGMYWPNGQKIIAGAKYIAKQDHLFAVYISNFRCGPDSFLLHFVRNEFKDKPFLHLELDEHSADAGIITRCEAFLDSLKGYEAHTSRKQKEKGAPAVIHSLSNNIRTLYFPYARDSVHILSAATRSCGIPSEVLPMQNEEDIYLGQKYANGQECYPLICTLGSFLKKLQEPGIDQKKVSFFMPDHNGPCRFGQYNRLQRIIFDNLGYRDVKIVHPSNEDSYASIAPGYSIRWRRASWKGVVALDQIRKMLEQIRPYELEPGTTDRIYNKHLQRIIASTERGGKDIIKTLRKAASEFSQILVRQPGSKPVVAIVGEIFMRDNPFCSNYLVKRLEELGAETLMAPFAEWVNYSTVRYIRDSRWKGNKAALYKAKFQYLLQKTMEKRIVGSISNLFDLRSEVEVEEMLDHCGEFIHRDYDGDPPLAIGTANILAGKQISGIVNILPFTCLPGTINCTVSQGLRKKHNNLPWENFAWDGTDNVGLDTRFEAFMHQVSEYAANWNTGGDKKSPSALEQGRMMNSHFKKLKDNPMEL